MSDAMAHFLEHDQVFPESPREIRLRAAREAAATPKVLVEEPPVLPPAPLVYSTQTQEITRSKPQNKIAKFCFGGAWINIPVGICETSRDGDAMVISFAEESSIELSQGMSLSVKIDGRNWDLKYSDVSLNFPSIPGTLHLFLVE